MKFLKAILIILLILSLTGMLYIYSFAFGPVNMDLFEKKQDASFNMNLGSLSNMQFYNNLRYKNSIISYKISDQCNLEKRYESERAFEILENNTILKFISTETNPEILISCQDKQEKKGDLFIAGEGGPVNITRSGPFNVISYGEVLLIRDSKCPNPNIALHEILHALGFNHSPNKNNIMYNVTDCDQEIGNEIPKLISEIYSVPSKPDLVLKEVNLSSQGKYFNSTIILENSGLNLSPNSRLVIYLDDKPLKTIDLSELNVGSGIKFTLENAELSNRFDEMKFIIETDYEELNKTNNEIIFKVKE